MKASRKLMTTFLFGPCLAFAQSATLETAQPGMGRDTGSIRPDTRMEQSERQRSMPATAEQDAAFIPEPGMPPMALAHTDNGVKYLCGGVGENEEAMMKDAAGQYDVALTFATSAGAYLTDVDVRITDSRGNAQLEVTCNAPILMVDLPREGIYGVRAEIGGHIVNRMVRVSNRRTAHSVLVWPSAMFGDDVAALPTR